MNKIRIKLGPRPPDASEAWLHARAHEVLTEARAGKTPEVADLELLYQIVRQLRADGVGDDDTVVFREEERRTVPFTLRELEIALKGGIEIRTWAPPVAGDLARVPPAVRDAIQDVINDTWFDEMEAAREATLENGLRPSECLFSRLVTIDNWLHGHELTPEYYLNGEDEE
jgi:hypothetical protein